MKNKDLYNPKDFLQPGNMLRLYASGAFPMADDSGEINWYLPEIRTIIPLNNYNYPRSLKKVIQSGTFEFKYDSDFTAVVNGCADRDKTWISKELIQAYNRLKKLGHVHTVETWKKGKLAGGLYGITFGGAFFGESMFSKSPQASKAALINLIEHLAEKKFVLLDVQYMTPHLKMFGAVEISFEEYTKLLNESCNRICEF